MSTITLNHTHNTLKTQVLDFAYKVADTLNIPVPHRVSPDAERAINAIHTLKLRLLQATTRDEVQGVKLSSLIAEYFDRLKTAKDDNERAEIQGGMRTILLEMSKAFAELHTHEAGVENVTPILYPKSLEELKSNIQIIRELLKDRKLSHLDHECLSQINLSWFTKFCEIYSNSLPVRGSITLNRFAFDDIYVDMENSSQIKFFLVEPDSMCATLNAQGEGTGLYLRDWLLFSLTLGEECLLKGYDLKELRPIVEHAYAGYNAYFYAWLQVRAAEKGLDKEQTLAYCDRYNGHMLAFPMNIKILLDKIRTHLCTVHEGNLPADDLAKSEKAAEHFIQLLNDTAIVLQTLFVDHFQKTMAQVLKEKEKLNKEVKNESKNIA